MVIPSPPPLLSNPLDPVYLMGFRALPPDDKADPLPSQYDWLKFKHRADGVPAHLWRIHDHLYDLSQFDHPGGQDFLEITQGTDITELFESSHYDIEKARKFLSKYCVGTAKEPRNCTFTFEPNGFYCQLRGRVLELMKTLKKNRIPYLKSTECLHDCYLILFVLSLAMGMYSKALILTFSSLLIASAALAFMAITAHNFFHHKNNWRMYTFDLTGNSSHEWRISHVYSHHCYPNSYFDYEATAFDAFLCWFPQPCKQSLVHKVKPFFVLLVVFPLQTVLVVRKNSLCVFMCVI